jgi:hypothetical protein
MAVQLQNGVTNLDGLHIAYKFISRAVAATGAAQTVAHGLSITPDFVCVIPTSGNDGMMGTGTDFFAVTAISADADNINFTTSEDGGAVDILAF